VSARNIAYLKGAFIRKNAQIYIQLPRANTNTENVAIFQAQKQHIVFYFMHLRTTKIAWWMKRCVEISGKPKNTMEIIDYFMHLRTRGVPKKLKFTILEKFGVQHEEKASAGVLHHSETSGKCFGVVCQISVGYDFGKIFAVLVEIW